MPAPTTLDFGRRAAAGLRLGRRRLGAPTTLLGAMGCKEAGALRKRWLQESAHLAAPHRRDDWHARRLERRPNPSPNLPKPGMQILKFLTTCNRQR